MTAARADALDPIQVPQADRPERIVDVLEVLRDGADVKRHVAPFDSRDFSYYVQAAQILGLVTRHRQVLPAGHAVLALPSHSQLARLAIAFEASECGQKWMGWSGVARLIDLDPDTARDFLRESSTLSDGTAKRRAATIRRWCQNLRDHHPAARERPLSVVHVPGRALVPRAVFNSKDSGQVVQGLAPGTHFLRVATAYFSVDGYEILVKHLSEALVRLLVGSPDACETVDQILNEFQRSIETGAPTADKRTAIQAFHRELVSGTTRVRYFDPRYEPRLHAKVYIFDWDVAYVTSANFTRNGLRFNIEAGYTTSAASDVRLFIDQFDYHFARGDDLLPRLLPALEESWAFAPAVPPYLLYLRVLLDLYFGIRDLPDAEYQLAEYQRMIVGSVLQVLRDRRGALLIAPTGTGKTVMAAYIAASLFPEEIRRVFVLCPNKSLESTWRQTFLRFGISAEVITHGILQEK
ncbi:MAG TPA: DEAD/DEAH box helicase family protein, partial [Gemmatimonadaceae bacterium]|nr:DEAD/DEAH box helicase family protein [Gemmatimonadaceae bacterium]